MSRLRTGIAAAAVSVAVLLTGCSSADSTGTTTAVTATAADDVFDKTRVHSIDVEVDEAALRTMIQTYLDSDDKEWIKATVTIDGQTFDNVGIKLKGNSSLRQITVDTPAQELPLRIRLDKYVDDQNVDGHSDVTVRSNSSETALNEAVALDLLSEAGLASEEAIPTRFSVNGSDEELRLTVQNLDDAWIDQAFSDAGENSVLYKADADGDWTWRGDDGDYTGSFDVEGGEENYAPLIELLDLVNNGTAEEIAEKLPSLLDVDAFATYLAFEAVVDNFDDIDGPGNNSYLFWDSSTEQFTVVAWDHNLAFGASPAGGQQGGDQRGGGPFGEPSTGDRPSNQPPSGVAPSTAPNQQSGEHDADGQQPGDPVGMAGTKGKENPLSTAFLANTEWKALYEKVKTELQADLIDDGSLTETVDTWSQLVTAGASDLVPAETITSEADHVRSYAD